MCQTKIMIFKTNNEKTSYMTLKPHIYNEALRLKYVETGEDFFGEYIWTKLIWDSHPPLCILIHTSLVRETSMGPYRKHGMSPWQL